MLKLHEQLKGCELRSLTRNLELLLGIHTFKNYARLRAKSKKKIALFFVLCIIALPTFSQVGLFPEKSITLDFQRSIDNLSGAELGTMNCLLDGDKYKVTIKGEGRIENRSRIKYDYDYAVSKTASGYETDMDMVMDPIHTRFNKQNAVRTYSGDKIFYPTVLLVGESLPDATGLFTLLLPGSIRVLQNVSIRNRKVRKVEDIIFRDKTYQASVLVSTFSFSSALDNRNLHSEVILLTEWWVPGLGLLKTTREADGSILTTKFR